MGNNQPKPDAHAFAERLNDVLDKAKAPGLRDGRGVWLSKRYKVSKATAQGWLNGQYLPVTQRVMDLAAFAGVRFEWLYYGTGPRVLNALQNGDSRINTGNSVQSRTVRMEEFRLAFKLASEALGDAIAHISPDEFTELGTLIYDLLVEDGMPEAQVLTFARRAAATYIRGETNAPHGEDHKDS